MKETFKKCHIYHRQWVSCNRSSSQKAHYMSLIACFSVPFQETHCLFLGSVTGDYYLFLLISFVRAEKGLQQNFQSIYRVSTSWGWAQLKHGLDFCLIFGRFDFSRLGLVELVGGDLVLQVWLKRFGLVYLVRFIWLFTFQTLCLFYLIW